MAARLGDSLAELAAQHCLVGRAGRGYEALDTVFDGHFHQVASASLRRELLLGQGYPA
ncbi:hypothetical protein D9M68_809950 [compost metagenome]